MWLRFFHCELYQIACNNNNNNIKNNNNNNNGIWMLAHKQWESFKVSVENLDEPKPIHNHLTVKDLVSIVFFYSQCKEQVLSWSWQKDSHAQNQVHDGINSYNKIISTSANFYIPMLTFTLKSSTNEYIKYMIAP